VALYCLQSLETQRVVMEKFFLCIGTKNKPNLRYTPHDF